ncbi:hypothetical protein KM043_005133 [Ampulex compressa]|nr:hypothetical protein KM043_005133 [Ampulex compressa]
MLATILLGLLAVQGNASPARMERMIVSEMRSSDLESSASGYAYDQRQGLPVSYVRYTNHGSGRYYHTPGTVSYVLGAPVALHEAAYEPAMLAYATEEREIVPYVEQPDAGIANYGGEQLHESYVHEEPRAPYYETLEATWRLPGATNRETLVEHEDNDDEDIEDEHNDEEEEEDENDEEESDDAGNNDFNREGDQDIGREFYGKLYHVADQPDGHSDSFLEDGNGGKYEAEEGSFSGEKGEKGYESRREFDEGEREEHDAKEDQGFYDDENGHKKDHADAAARYGQSEEAAEDEKGGSFGRTTYHKKGHKTNGFHNVYHKDEYKKDTDFYDEDHNEGQFDKYANEEERRETLEGGFEKGRRYDSGFDRREDGKKGRYEKGQERSHDEGHGRHEAEDSYRHNSENYATEKGANSIQKQRYDKQYAD